MTLEVRPLTREDWRVLSDQAHLASFGEHRPPNFERIDFALLIVERETNIPQGYITCTALNSELLKWGFGGAFPLAKGTYKVMAGYRLALEFCRAKGWLHVVTLVKNDNFASLRMHLKERWKPIGVTNFLGDVLVELHKDLREDF